MVSTSTYQTVRKFGTGTMVVLYQIDLTNQGAGVYYFTNDIFEERVPIVYGGNTYVHLPVAMESIDTSSDAGPAQPRFMLATSGGPVNALIMNYKDLRGAKVTRIRTFAEFLDQMPDGNGGVTVNPGADSAAHLPPDLFVIDRKVSSNNTMAEFQLVSPTDQEGVQIPLGVVSKRYCRNVYRHNNGDGTFTYTGRSSPCPWGNPVADGGRYYDINDASTTAANDRCSKTLNGCAIRFGAAAGLPFGGFPGVKSPGEPG